MKHNTGRQQSPSKVSVPNGSKLVRQHLYNKVCSPLFTLFTIILTKSLPTSISNKDSSNQVLILMHVTESPTSIVE